MKVQDVLHTIGYYQDIDIFEVSRSMHGEIRTPIFPADLIINRFVLENDFPNILEREMVGGLCAENNRIVIKLKGE